MSEPTSDRVPTDFASSFTRFRTASEDARRTARALEATCRREEEERAVVEAIARLPLGVAAPEHLVHEARRLVEKYAR